MVLDGFHPQKRQCQVSLFWPINGLLYILMHYNYLLSIEPCSCFKQNDVWSISLSEKIVSSSTIRAQIRDIKISDALKFPGIFTLFICFKWSDLWLITPSKTLVSGSTITARIRDIIISDALKLPATFTQFTCFKQNDIWYISYSEKIVSGVIIMAQVRALKYSDALKFPGPWDHVFVWNVMIFDRYPSQKR